MVCWSDQESEISCTARTVTAPTEEEQQQANAYSSNDRSLRRSMQSRCTYCFSFHSSLSLLLPLHFLFCPALFCSLLTPSLTELFSACQAVCRQALFSTLMRVFMLCVFACTRVLQVAVWLVFTVISDGAWMCMCETEKQHLFDHWLPMFASSTCLCVSMCVNVCDPPVVTVLKSKLTSTSPCNSICPSARPLGGYREREHRGGRWRRSES